MARVLSSHHLVAETGLYRLCRGSEFHGSNVQCFRQGHCRGRPALCGIRSTERCALKRITRIAGKAQGGPELSDVVARVANGDQEAFATLYDEIAGPVYGLVLKVLRDPSQSEEVAQEVMIEVWRTAPRYRPDQGSVRTWVMTMAHHRAVDRVRSEQAAADREKRNAARERTPDFDQVSEEVTARLESEQVRRCLRTLTELQRQSVTLAYYSGYTYAEVAAALSAPLGTVKTRMRDGLIRLRDCMGVVSA